MNKNPVNCIFSPIAATAFSIFLLGAHLVYGQPASTLSTSSTQSTSSTSSSSSAPAFLCTARATGHSNTPPDRLDDIFWENDRTAHRIYGPGVSQPAPAGEGLVSSGIDVWVKRVRTPFMDKQLMTGKQHNDNGEGRDCYDVGTTRGCGGLGIWDDAAKKLLGSANWEANGGFVSGPDVASFWVTYAPWDAGSGRKVKEKRTFTLPAGTNFTRMVSVIDDASTPANSSDLLVGIGLAKRKADGARFVGPDQWTADKEKGAFVYWEPDQPGYLGAPAGHIGVAVLVDPKSIVKVVEDDPTQSLIIVKVKPGQPWVYYTGACWSLGLDFKTQPEWEKYAKEFEANFDPDFKYTAEPVKQGANRP